jgi:hypothetical protein
LKSIPFSKAFHSWTTSKELTISIDQSGLRITFSSERKRTFSLCSYSRKNKTALRERDEGEIEKGS